MKENRKHERVDARLRCWCEGENVTFYARVGNLSEGGLFLRTSTPLVEGTTARIRFGTLEKEPQVEVEAQAVVVWTRSGPGSQPAGMGLRFENVDSKILAAIRRIMETEQRVKHRLAQGS